MKTATRLICTLATILGASACSVTPLSLGGFACESGGGCASDYSCDQVSNVCITAGDGCGTDGATSPCTFGETTCAKGCRTCSGGAWTECEVCTDADGDGIGDGTNGNVSCTNTVTDLDDGNPRICADTDSDGCDDCAVTTWDPTNDGNDADGDGLCDAGDDCTDGDGDGFGNGSGTPANGGCPNGTATDGDDGNASACADTEAVHGSTGDGCDDCSSGSFDPANDGIDTDGDTICDGAADWCAGRDDTLCGAAGPVCDGLVKLTFTCNGPGDCPESGVVDCDDNDPCTADTCDATAATTCTNTATPAGGDCGTCGLCDAGGVCQYDDTQDADCPVCEECSDVFTCTAQADGTDVKDDCPATTCNLGTCDGASACNVAAAGVSCGTCETCDGSGTCAPQPAGTDINDDCDDGTFCNGDEKCDGAAGCGAPPGDPCTIPGSCDEATDTCGCANDSECSACQTCDTTAGACVNANAGADPRNDCDAADPCRTGDCDGSGACEGTTAGISCDVCGACDGAGSCAYDGTRDADCAVACQECSILGSCADQAAGSDVNNDCDKGTNPCFTGLCDGTGSCALEGAGVDCGVCGACDAFGVCGYDSSQDADCTSTCQECSNLGACADQQAGFDIKGECDDGVFCNGLEKCDGNGACDPPLAPPAGDPCSGTTCDETNKRCAGCLDDNDCGPCMQCNTSGGAGNEFCEPQAAGGDSKNDCDSATACLTGNCDGGGACALDPQGTACDVCGSCDTSGLCGYDPTRDSDCTMRCQECSSLGNCADQPPGSDVNSDCPAMDACNLGCDGAGNCAVANSGVPCGTCTTCDAAGGCNQYDASADSDCPVCKECSGVGTCTNQSAGTDGKAECADAFFCNGVEACNGNGMCELSLIPPAGSPCTSPPDLVCDEATDGCVECLTDFDCPTCMECNPGSNTCQNQPSGDLKNDCSNSDPCLTGNCDGAGACALTGSGVSCDICGTCDSAGACQYDGTLHGDCPGTCEQCASLGACIAQGAGTDLNNDCSDGTFCNGDEVCAAGGVCDPTSPGNPCTPLLCIEASSSCGCSVATDCGFCQDCSGGTCVDQTGTDVKGDCPAMDTCNLGCGAGSCAVAATGTPCDDPPANDGNICNSTCDALGVCDGATPAADGTACDDGFGCTSPAPGNDTCTGGVCGGAKSDGWCFTNSAAGDLCWPTCSPDATGCVTPPTSMSLACTSPVSLASTPDSACTATLTGGDNTGQAACVSCNAEVGVKVLSFDDFTGCSTGGWTAQGGLNCYDEGRTCPMTQPNGRPCGSTVYCGNWFSDEALEADNAVWGWEIWRFNHGYDTTGLTDIRVCFEYADIGAGGGNERVQLDVEDGSNFQANVWCDPDGNGPRAGADQLWVPYCVNLPAWASNNPNLLLSFYLHSDTNNQRIAIDDILVTGNSGGCTPTAVPLFSDNFDSCDPAGDGWTIVTGTPICPGSYTCGGAGTIHADNDAVRLRRTFDFTSLDGDIQVCFDLTEDNANAGGEAVELLYDIGAGLQVAWAHNGDKGANQTCQNICVNLSAIEPGVNNNPAVDLQLSAFSDDAGRTVGYDNLSITGVQNCLATPSEISLTAPPTPGAAGDYDFTATDSYNGGQQLKAKLTCDWTPDTTVTASDEVQFVP